MSRVLSSGAAAAPGSFKFRARHETVDWRRISAVDVDRVACELDFQTLQDHITAVTFCNVVGERCPRCQSQVDPALLKLFRLAQFTVEYLLHSQDCLTLSLQAAEERLQAEAQEREQLVAQLQKQTQDAKSLKEELRQRKKIIASQQAMITAGTANYHKVGVMLPPPPFQSTGLAVIVLVLCDGWAVGRTFSFCGVNEQWLWHCVKFYPKNLLLRAYAVCSFGIVNLVCSSGPFLTGFGTESIWP